MTSRWWVTSTAARVFLSSRVGQLVEITLREGRRLSCIYLVHSDATAVNTAAGAGGCTAALCRWCCILLRLILCHSEFRPTERPSVLNLSCHVGYCPCRSTVHVRIRARRTTTPTDCLGRSDAYNASVGRRSSNRYHIRRVYVHYSRRVG